MYINDYLTKIDRLLDEAQQTEEDYNRINNAKIKVDELIKQFDNAKSEEERFLILYCISANIIRMPIIKENTKIIDIDKLAGAYNIRLQPEIYIKSKTLLPGAIFGEYVPADGYKGLEAFIFYNRDISIIKKRVTVVHEFAKYLLYYRNKDTAFDIYWQYTETIFVKNKLDQYCNILTAFLTMPLSLLISTMEYGIELSIKKKRKEIPSYIWYEYFSDKTGLPMHHTQRFYQTNIEFILMMNNELNPSKHDIVKNEPEIIDELKQLIIRYHKLHKKMFEAIPE